MKFAANFDNNNTNMNTNINNTNSNDSMLMSNVKLAIAPTLGENYSDTRKYTP